MHFASTLYTTGCGAPVFPGQRTTNFDDVTCDECLARGPRYGADRCPVCGPIDISLSMHIASVHRGIERPSTWARTVPTSQDLG